MVKNKTGGNKAKKFARKDTENIINRKIRYACDKDELYGIATKIIGNGQVIVLCIDGKERLCFIRNKFSGRNKHNNLITLGSWVIVGKRSWETAKEGKLEKCDLLEIYSHQERSTLIQECKQDLSVLLKQEYINQNQNDGDGLNDFITFKENDNNNNTIIGDDRDIDNNNNNNNINKKKENNRNNEFKVNDINFDDI
jgi:initiation factor 1A